MLHSYQGINLQDVVKTALYELMTTGDTVSPRGMETKEFTPAVFQIQNPLSRIITLPSRKMNVFYGMIETLWYMNGDNSLEPLVYYNKAMANFSDDGKTLRGAYGARLIQKDQALDKSQFGLVYDKLKQDPMSRQAVAVIWNPWIDYVSTKDVPCTVAFMFSIRDNKLNMTTIMRSNDIILGTTYDVFAFTMFQEFLARKLGVELGTYTHVANSFHIYEMHYDLAWKMIRDNNPVMLMPEMPDTSWSTFNELYRYEAAVRTANPGSLNRLIHQADFGDYWNQWAYMIVLHRASKDKDAATGQHVWTKLIEPYRELTVKVMERLI